MHDFAAAFEAIRAGQPTPADIASALVGVAETNLDDYRMDHINTVIEVLDRDELRANREARFLSAERLVNRQQAEFASGLLREMPGAASDPEIVGRILALDSDGLDSYDDEAGFWEANLASLPAGLPRAERAAHLAALYYNGGSELGADHWMTRAAALYDHPDRATHLRAYYAAHDIRYADDLVR